MANASPIRIQVVRRSDKIGFVVIARRWVVERLFAWINRNRRLAKDAEASIASAEAFLRSIQHAAPKQDRTLKNRFETDPLTELAPLSPAGHFRRQGG